IPTPSKYPPRSCLVSWFWVTGRYTVYGSPREATIPEMAPSIIFLGSSAVLSTYRAETRSHTFQNRAKSASFPPRPRSSGDSLLTITDGFQFLNATLIFCSPISIPTQPEAIIKNPIIRIFLAFTRLILSSSNNHHNPATQGSIARGLALFISLATCLWCLAHSADLSLPIILPRSVMNLDIPATSLNVGSLFSLQKMQLRGTLIFLFLIIIKAPLLKTEYHQQLLRLYPSSWSLILALLQPEQLPVLPRRGLRPPVHPGSSGVPWTGAGLLKRLHIPAPRPVCGNPVPACLL